MAIRFQFYRKTAADWTSANPVLFAGELGLETDTGKFKFGDGSSAWNARPYAGASVGTVPWGAITGTLSAQTDLQNALNAKQATLVSATNIKTINGNSILGSGDLVVSGGGGSATWGSITGTLSAQTDLNTALTARALLAGATFTGAISATNLSGTNTGDQTITLTGDVTGSGTGSFAATIAAGAVTVSKMANLAAGTILGNNTGGATAPIALTSAQVKALLSITAGDVSGLAPVATSGSASDLGAGTLPAARFDDTAHGNRSGGALHANVVASGASGFMTGADKTKLDGIAAGATANQTDAFLLNRTNHTGTQLAATISDFASASRAETEAELVAGTNITITPSGSGAARQLTIAASGGGGSPGGASGEIQFNNAGAFAGAADVEIESGQLRLPAIATPTAPAAGGVKIFGRDLASRIVPAWVGPSGVDTSIQSALHSNSIFLVSPGNAALPTATGGTITVAATVAHFQSFASSGRWNATRRMRGSTNTTAGNAAGIRTAYAQWFRGSAAGFGGFFFRAQFGMSINLNGGQKFLGLCASAALLAGEPSALLNMCGVGYDSTDASTGNWQFMRNDGAGTATKVDLGTSAARNTTEGYDLVMFMTPGGSDLFVRIENLNTGTLVLNTSYNTDLPAVNTGMAMKCEVRNGAVAAADSIEVAKIYIETDY